MGAAAIDATGDPYPDETHRVCLAADAVLFGAIGDPKYDNDPTAKVRPEQGLLRMRKSLGLFANLRPVALFDALADRSPALRIERTAFGDGVTVFASAREEALPAVQTALRDALGGRVSFADGGRGYAEV